MAIIHKCACGKRMSKHASKCNACHKAHMESLRAQARADVATGKCPKCGSPLVRNLALAGWWQCAGYADINFRKPEHAHLPRCGFQTFTE